MPKKQIFISWASFVRGVVLARPLEIVRATETIVSFFFVGLASVIRLVTVSRSIAITKHSGRNDELPNCSSITVGLYNAEDFLRKNYPRFLSH
jgi:hypothetical protein